MTAQLGVSAACSASQTYFHQSGPKRMMTSLTTESRFERLLRLRVMMGHARPGGATDEPMGTDLFDVTDAARFSVIGPDRLATA